MRSRRSLLREEGCPGWSKIAPLSGRAPSHVQVYARTLASEGLPARGGAKVARYMVAGSRRDQATSCNSVVSVPKMRGHARRLRQGRARTSANASECAMQRFLVMQMPPSRVIVLPRRNPVPRSVLARNLATLNQLTPSLGPRRRPSHPITATSI